MYAFRNVKVIETKHLGGGVIIKTEYLYKPAYTSLYGPIEDPSDPFKINF